MLQIHLDTDMGSDIDDLCALAMLLNLPHVRITGITTVGEHQGLRAGMVQHVLDLVGRDIPVAAGADTAHHPYSITPWFLPLDKYWPEQITPRPGPVERALELLKRSIEQGAVIVGIGSYSNLALLEARYSGILSTAHLVLMGGHLPFEYNPLEALPWFVSEHNFQSDPAASRLILERAEPLFVPVNVTTQTALCKSHLIKLAHAGPVAELIAHQAKAHLRQFHFDRIYGGKDGLPKDLINFLHDALACAVATGWAEVKMERHDLSWQVCEDTVILRLDPKGKSLRFVTAIPPQPFGDCWVSTCCPPRQQPTACRKAHGWSGQLQRMRPNLAAPVSLTN